MAWETVPTVGIPEALTESGPVLTNFHRPEDTKEAVERALYAILGHGAFQRRIMACSLLSMVVLLCHSLAYRAIASPVDHWCARPAAFGAMPVPLWRNVAIPVESDGSFSQCTVYEPPVPADDALDHTRHAVPCESWEYATAFRNRSIVSEWDLVCERRRLVQLSSAAYMAGAMLCVPIVGLLSDRTGRKPVITGSVSALILAAIVCSTTHSFVVFVLSRMVVSAMSSAAQVLSFILLYEVTGPDRRAAYALLATGTGIMLMPVVLELLAAAQFSWPATQLLLLMPTVSLVYSHYLLEESPSWLLATWRLKRAEEALLVAARRNGLVVEKAARFFRKLKAEMRRHAHAHLAATAAEAIRSDANKTAGSDSMVAEFLSGRRAVSVFLAWFTVMFCFYGIQLADQDLDGGVDAWLRWDDVAYVVTLAPLIAGTYAGMLRYGQRRTFTMLLALVFEASALLVLVPLTAERDWLPSALVKVSYTVPFMNVVMMVLAFGTLVAVQTAPEPAAQAGKGGGGNAPAIGSPSSGSTAVEGSEAPAQTTDRFAGWDVAHDSTAPMTSTLARSSAQLQQSGSIEARDDSIESASGGVPFDANISKLPDEF
ncbi:solute carrier family 22 member 7-like isoform X3 [Dermacentor albipictus]|uniref:solute carrier family 22 member 7-like isoform X3 n=1 Tax=Dermacentor albipictus TaxID=60249 RepID=UPI0031FC9BCD